MDYQKEILEVIGYKIEEAARAEVKKHTTEILKHLKELHYHNEDCVFAPLPGWKKHQGLSGGQTAVKDVSIYDLLQDLEGKLMHVYLPSVIRTEARKFYQQIVNTPPAESPTQENLTFIDVDTGTIIAAPEVASEDTSAESSEGDAS